MPDCCCAISASGLVAVGSCGIDVVFAAGGVAGVFSTTGFSRGGTAGGISVGVVFPASGFSVNAGSTPEDIVVSCGFAGGFEEATGVGNFSIVAISTSSSNISLK